MRKKIEISLEHKIFEEIQRFCEFNNIKIEKYIEEAVIDKYYIFKYGDLNEKIKVKKNPEVKKTLPPTEVPTELPKKKVGRPKKVIKPTETLVEKKTLEPTVKRRIIIAK